MSRREAARSAPGRPRTEDVGVNESLLSSIRETSVAGTVSGLLMAAVIATASRLRTGHAAPGLNAISHMLWGPQAGRQSDWSLRHTGTGVVLNQLACLFWAACYVAMLRNRRPSLSERPIAHALGISLLAYVTDYHVVPRRVTPGFELVFPPSWYPSLYVGLAACLRVGVLFCRRRR